MAVAGGLQWDLTPVVIKQSNTCTSLDLADRW